jgi:putative heme iron utilization protein
MVGMANDAHARSDAEAEPPLCDPDVPTPTHGERTRTLLAGIHTGTLCTIAKEPAGYPYGSFVTFALDGADPVFLISALAEHTRNLKADPRASLLVAETGEADPLANGRVTLVGEVRRLEAGAARDSSRQAYLAAHPKARYYVDYADFAFWRLEVAAVRYIGGYGRMSWVDLPDYRQATPDPIGPHARAILEHMNADHAEAMVGWCRALTKAHDTTAAVMTAVDRYGCELSVATSRGQRPVRLPFPAPISSPEEARREMVALSRRSREIAP